MSNNSFNDMSPSVVKCCHCNLKCNSINSLMELITEIFLYAVFLITSALIFILLTALFRWFDMGDEIIVTLKKIFNLH